MGYVEQNLISGEQVVHRTRLHWVVLIPPTLIAALFGIPGLIAIYFGVFSTNQDVSKGPASAVGLGLLFIGVMAFAGGMLHRSSGEFAITNKRVILKSGLFHRRTLELFLNKIESVSVDQGLMGRILGYGSIDVRGTGGTMEPFDKITGPLEFRKQMQEYISRISPTATPP